MAQSEPVLVITARSANDSEALAERGVQEFEQALRDAGLRVLDTSRYALSETPAELSDELVSELHACINAAITAFSARQIERGHEEIARCRALINEARSVLLHDDTSAVEVLDSCLVLVRAILDDTRGRTEEAARIEALAQGRFCRTEVPIGTPSERRHTEAVEQLLREVDGQIRATGGILVVRHSDESVCEVRVNGRPIGRTPAFRRLTPATYRVEAVCPNGPMRTERVAVPAGEEIEIVLQPRRTVDFSSFDALERTARGTLAFVYDEISPSAFYRDASRLAEALGARHFVTLRLARRGRDRAYVIGRHDERGRATRALRVLDDERARRAQMVRFMEGWFPATTIAAPSPPPPREPSFDPTPHIIGATGLAIAGAGALATAAGFVLGPPRCLERTGSGVCAVYGAEWATFGPVGVTGLGALLASTGWLLGAVAEDSAAWHIAGGVSAALAAGAAGAAIANATLDSECVQRNDAGGCVVLGFYPDGAVATFTAGAIVAALGAAAYFIVGATDPGQGPRLRVGLGLGSMQLEGSF